MNCFQTITQFIDIDDEEYNRKKYNKNACHFFALKTAYEFMKKKECSKTTHEANIYYAINVNKAMANKELYFDEIIKFTNLNKNDICATSTEIIKSGDFPIELIFPDSKNSYCVIVLKNSKYFNVIFYNDRYFIRDCHEPFQYDFNTKNELINYLNKTYQFNESIIVDGFPIPEFSSIEYIFVDKPFEFTNNIMKGNNKDTDEVLKTDSFKETEFGISIGIHKYEHDGGDNIKVINKKESKEKENMFHKNKNKNLNSKYDDEILKDSKYDDLDDKSIDYDEEVDYDLDDKTDKMKNYAKKVLGNIIIPPVNITFEKEDEDYPILHKKKVVKNAIEKDLDDIIIPSVKINFEKEDLEVVAPKIDKSKWIESSDVINDWNIQT